MQELPLPELDGLPPPLPAVLLLGLLLAAPQAGAAREQEARHRVLLPPWSLLALHVLVLVPVREVRKCHSFMFLFLHARYMYYTNVFLPWFDCLVTVFYLCLSFFVFLQRKHVGGLKTEIVFLQRKHVGGLKTEIEVAPFFLQTSDFFALTP